MAIFTLLAKLGLDTVDFQAGIKRAQSAASSLGKGISDSLKRENDNIKSALAGMFTVSAAKSYFGDLKNIVDEIKDMSDLLSISTDEVQMLQKATSLAGQNFGSIVSAFQRIESLRAKAVTGDEKALGLFSILGIDPGKGSAIDVMRSAVEASGRGVRENAAAFELLGKKVSGVRLIVEELAKLGPINLIKESDLNAMDSAINRFEEAKRQFEIAGAPIATTMAQGLTGLANLFNPENRARQEAINEAYRQGKHTLAKDFELSAMSLLGMEDQEGTRYAALPLPENRSKPQAEDATALLIRIARANEETAQVLSNNVRQ